MPIQEFDFAAGKTLDPRRNQAIAGLVEEADVAMLKNTLRARNLQFAGEAAELRELLALVRKSKTGLLFLDAEMPGVNIAELIPSVQKAFPEVKIALVGAALTKELLQQVAALGLAGVLAKPLNEEAIVKLFSRLK